MHLMDYNFEQSTISLHFREPLLHVVAVLQKSKASIIRSGRKTKQQELKMSQKLFMTLLIARSLSQHIITFPLETL